MAAKDDFEKERKLIIDYSIAIWYFRKLDGTL